jgi:putative membrane protein
MLLTLMASLAAGISAPAQAVPSAEKFVNKASEANLFEIQSSKLALNKSQNADIKQFAQNMIDDHTDAGNKLKAAVTSGNIDQSQVATSLNSSHQKIMNKLANASGDDFDKQYVSAQMDAHKDAVKLFTKYSKNGDNASLKDFAAQTLPVLQTHLTHIKTISSSM